jgi:hypothetical protein
MQKKKEQSSEELYGKLGEAFNFTYGDLEANRAGFMTWQQKRLVSKEARNRISLFLLLAIMYFAITAGISTLSDDPAKNSGLFWGIFVLVALMGIAWVWGYGVHKLFLDIGNGKVQNIVRYVRKETRNVYKQGKRTFLVAGDKEFYLPRRSENFEWNNVQYRIFFLPKSDFILSVEEVLPE